MSDARPIDTADLAEVLSRVHAALRARRTEIDELNVFPVPDGDTGTNMTMTAAAALAVAEDAQLEDIEPREIVRAGMRGARGNSGVILSQVLRSLIEVVDADGPLDARGLATFLRRARDLAYEAVAEPIEGTVLTALTVAAETAELSLEQGDDLLEASDHVRLAVHAAVERTTEQLDALRDAGVVDAGARGFEIVVEAIHAYLCDEPFDAAVPPTPHVERARGELSMREAGSLEYRFEVQYLLDAPDETAPDLREALELIGDSVVVSAAGGLVTVHVHTNDVGAAIEEGLRHGRPSRIEVTYFADQMADPTHESRVRAQHQGAASERDAADRAVDDAISRMSDAERGQADAGGPHLANLGCIVVLPGPGLRELAEEHGAVVVEGASGALPSVADLLNAIGDVKARRVAILPGHRNAVPVAKQASDVSVAEGGRTLDVVSSASTPVRALAALAVCDPDGDPESVLVDMDEAAGEVRSGEVVAAVRDADTPVGEVRRGQHLAVCDGEVEGVHDDPVEALAAVARACAGDECELVTLVIGAEVDGAERGRAISAVRHAVEGADVEIVMGGQRPARYLVGCE